MVGLGVNATEALVFSQVVLSLVLPAPMVAMLVLMRRPGVMGSFPNSRLTSVAALVATVFVLFLNAILVAQALGVPVPFLSAG